MGRVGTNFAFRVGNEFRLPGGAALKPGAVKWARRDRIKVPRIIAFPNGSTIPLRPPSRRKECEPSAGFPRPRNSLPEPTSTSPSTPRTNFHFHFYSQNQLPLPLPLPLSPLFNGHSLLPMIPRHWASTHFEKPRHPRRGGRGLGVGGGGPRDGCTDGFIPFNGFETREAFKVW